MGNPLLVDTFHANRWDYLYSLQPGGGERQQERMSVLFNGNDQLVGLSGDFMPGVSKDQAILGSDTDTNVVPQQGEPQKVDEPPKPGSMLEDIQRDVDGVKTVPVPTPQPLDVSPQ
ncbi:outer membrane protein assembly factor BamE (lipoprotein component of BamABCDE complex) [Pseudomonas sp. PvP001]